MLCFGCYLNLSVSISRLRLNDATEEKNVIIKGRPAMKAERPDYDFLVLLV